MVAHPSDWLAAYYARQRLVGTLEDNGERVYSEKHRDLVRERIDPLPEHFEPHVKPFDREAHGIAPSVGAYGPKPGVSANTARRTSWTADELLAEVFPEPRWAVPGVLAEGLNLLAGAPKLGKSWFALNIAVAVAAGGNALGRVDVEQGDVLYLALEDPPRRMQNRLRKLLRESSPSARLTVAVECESLAVGGLDRIRRWLQEHPLARLVVVDVFARVRGQVDARADRYLVDYLSASSLKDLADEHGVAILVVHHTRKQDSSDFVDMVSGTSGLAGAADAVLVLTRARNTKQAVLKLTGRDVAEAEYPLELDTEIGCWTMLDGPAADYDLGDTRRRILQHVRDHDACTPTQLSDALDVNLNTVKVTVRRMVDDDQIDTDGAGHYFAPVTRNTRNPATEGDTGYMGYTDIEPER